MGPTRRRRCGCRPIILSARDGRIDYRLQPEPQTEASSLRAHERRVQEAASGGKLTARRAFGLLLAALGLALLLVSAIANPLDIGKGGFGWKQIVGVIVGAAVAVVGAALALAGRRTSSAV